jgi:putative NIF3 family GTP cyclohydrolase 1 type 2
MPEYGVRDSWAKFLNFIPEHCDVNSFYRTSKVDNMTVITIAQKICEKTSEFGQRTIKMIAKNPQKKIKRIVTGTGAITELPKMYETGAELIVATDDGIHTTYCGLWSLDLDIPVIVVDHAVAELPAIVTLAEFIKQKFPAVPVEYLPGEFPADEIITKI